MGLSGVLPSDTVKQILGEEVRALPSLAEIEAQTADIDDDEETIYG
jgi:hypothetical protein